MIGWTGRAADPVRDRSRARRMVIRVVVAALCAIAAVAVGILLFGSFGRTQQRILSTTLVLSAFGILSLPALILMDRGRLRPLALASLALNVAGAALVLVSVWSGSGDELGRAVATVVVFALASAQVAALTARPGDRSPAERRMLAASTALALVLAIMGTTAAWAQIGAAGFYRIVGALVVIDLLLVVLQPLTARGRAGRPARAYRLVVVDEAGRREEREQRSADLAATLASAVRAAERDGRGVTRVEAVRVDARGGAPG